MKSNRRLARNVRSGFRLDISSPQAIPGAAILVGHSIVSKCIWSPKNAGIRNYVVDDYHTSPVSSYGLERNL